jgi:hypothetical protein
VYARGNALTADISQNNEGPHALREERFGGSPPSIPLKMWTEKGPSLVRDRSSR